MRGGEGQQPTRLSWAFSPPTALEQGSAARTTQALPATGSLSQDRNWHLMQPSSHVGCEMDCHRLVERRERLVLALDGARW